MGSWRVYVPNKVSVPLIVYVLISETVDKGTTIFPSALKLEGLQKHNQNTNDHARAI